MKIPQPHQCEGVINFFFSSARREMIALHYSVIILQLCEMN